MGDAAYSDNGAGASGPTLHRWVLPRGEGLAVRVGSSAAARIVECNPRRRQCATGRPSPPEGSGIRAGVSKHPASTRGLIAAPWTPASRLLCCREERHETLTATKTWLITLTSPRLHSRPSSPAGAAAVARWRATSECGPGRCATPGSALGLASRQSRDLLSLNPVSRPQEY